MAPLGDPPPTYVQAGSVVGVVSHYMTLGLNAEVGRQLTPHLWLHATATRSSLDELFVRGRGTLMQATLGLDYIRCSDNGIFCVFGGADVGVRSIQYSGMEYPLFCDGSCDPGTPVEDHRTSAIGAVRAGWEIGSQHVRFRTALEATATPHVSLGALITDSLVIRF